MIEKVTLQLNEDSKFSPEDGRGCEGMRPKELLLYAAAQCAGQTALMIMQKEHFTPKRFEISYSGEVTPRDAQTPSLFSSFHVVYNVECGSDDDQAAASRAIRLTHDKYCGMTQMLRRIAPVSDEIAIVATEAAEA